jgi:acyl-CoA hydrolase
LRINPKGLTPYIQNERFRFYLSLAGLYDFTTGGLTMENHNVVRTEHLNHKGSLFGGQLLRWVDECAYMAAKMQFPQYNLVTRAMAQVEFRKGIHNGTILRFESNLENVGTSSATYKVEVFAYPPYEPGGDLVFETRVTFVAVDDYGEKVKIEHASN